jgi:hypothetical protein
VLKELFFPLGKLEARKDEVVSDHKRSFARALLQVVHLE